MIQVNKKHSVQYKNGYFILTWWRTTEKGEQAKAKIQTYPNIGAMIMQCGFEMGYEYTDAAMQSKANYDREISKAFIEAKNKEKAKNEQ